MYISTDTEPCFGRVFYLNPNFRFGSTSDTQAMKPGQIIRLTASGQ